METETKTDYTCIDLMLCEAYEVGWDFVIDNDNNNLTKILQLRTLAKALLVSVLISLKCKSIKK